MGICAEPGLFVKTCRACRERIELISTGAEISACPYCGSSLMDIEPTEEQIAHSLDMLQRQVLRLRNTKDETELKRLRNQLQSTMWTLSNELEFVEKDLTAFHTYFCPACNWSGFNTPSFLNGPYRGKAVCPDCFTEVIERESRIK